MTHRTYLSLAIPLIISTITTPLLGAVDTAVVGQLSNPAYIGGVAVGTIIFNTMYWLFGFLRVSTSGFTAQAYGAQDDKQCFLYLARPFLIALFIGIIFILIQSPIKSSALTLINPDKNVTIFADEYFSLRIWGAPFALANYVILGWLMGMTRIKISLFLQVFMNALNIVLDLFFVNILHQGVKGVAAATLIAEMSAFLIGMYMVLKSLNLRLSAISSNELWNIEEFKKMMTVNRDLFIRTICLLTVFNMFTAKGATFGTEILAANTVLIQIHYIMAYFFDGFANASSILVGKAVGAKDESLYKRTLLLSFQWAIISSLLVMLVYIALKNPILQVFTNNENVIKLASSYSVWVAIFPVAAGFGLIFYGVFTGATKTAPIRNSMLISLAFYVIFLLMFTPSLHNHGLWLSFIIFSLGRSLFLVMYIPRLNRTLFEK
ncbi:MATE family multidrug resistance protein [Anoxybacillus vitaminiphilus]|uniref:Probable multidrug resistance protein NorM n=1 Tax=Paranoxybacillus vitaminiphilus TaxID=581036 RepID=A0A327YM10_9BACL|nr:MATE family efflux transporter [Anoxybacillus vitaminiphilus]RAK22038.1 MATE family multidrug resistance protein [Anoxybacillus vitaminiphilus]